MLLLRSENRRAPTTPLMAFAVGLLPIWPLKVIRIATGKTASLEPNDRHFDGIRRPRAPGEPMVAHHIGERSHAR